ncbi:MAG: TolC family protein, partial [Bacteroidales bacterium]|nr:TolC family protein [Bacteroidales bacterium]
PGLYTAQRRAKEIETQMANNFLQIKTIEIKKEVSSLYFKIQNLKNKQLFLANLLTTYENLAKNSKTEKELGNINNLDLLDIQFTKQQFYLKIKAIESEIKSNFILLQTIMNYKDSFNIVAENEIIAENFSDSNLNISLEMFTLENALAGTNIKIEKRKTLPNFSINYYIGTNHYTNSDYYHGFEIGIAFPLFYGNQKAQIKSSVIALESQNQLNEYKSQLLYNKIMQYNIEIEKLKEQIDFYQNSGNQLKDELVRTATKLYELGEIDLKRLNMSLENALQIQMEYLENVYNYNIKMIELIYLTN